MPVTSGPNVQNTFSFASAVDERMRNKLYGVKFWVDIFSGLFDSAVVKRTRNNWYACEGKSGPVFCSLAALANWHSTLANRLHALVNWLVCETTGYPSDALILTSTSIHTLCRTFNFLANHKMIRIFHFLSPSPSGGPDSDTLVFCCQNFWNLHQRGSKFCQLFWKNTPTGTVSEVVFIGGMLIKFSW